MQHSPPFRFALFAILMLASLTPSAPAIAAPGYARPHTPDAPTLAQSVPPPAGFVRVPASAGSWATWLRGLPMKPPGTPVQTFTGANKWRQDVHAAVIDIDVGRRDLQQCADAIMRLRGEWLFTQDRKRDIRFNNTEGKPLAFSARRDQSYPSFRKYMDYVFAYAGTYSLERELKPVALTEIAIGDVFIKGGFPGHAVLVADMVENPGTGEKRFLLLQSYMPAQNIHVLRNMHMVGAIANNPAPDPPANENAADGSPWYPAAFDGELITPEWTFSRQSLRRWP
ncbi:DUF4846 domain-containing protein [Hyphomicrobium sp. D-2]|uniref:DUF4846 domain-containing protein n=1 Tax=Hyphomicrobium sp. D-2 TaxID=3041621 RepID=UPI002453A382|nr:DUF4846 domain-containing protein [Hyphomicrobium sp. D-2]MDH4982815.1 DUF4846 domain-containing protein [Hyphomicrobium sp. D-2]